MARRDNVFNSTCKEMLALASNADDTAWTSRIIDTAGALSVSIYIHVHTAADANCTVAVVLSDSDDSGMSGGAAVADEYLIGTEAGMAIQFDSETKVAKLGYTGHKRYIQFVATPTGNTGTLAASATVVLERTNPVANSTQLAVITA